jgi:hypothetical protein
LTCRSDFSFLIHHDERRSGRSFHCKFIDATHTHTRRRVREKNTHTNGKKKKKSMALNTLRDPPQFNCSIQQPQNSNNNNNNNPK